MKTALRLLLAPYRFSVDRLFRMGEVGWAHWYDDPDTLYRRRNRLTYTGSYSSSWTLDNSGAVNPTVTTNYAVAPNGTTTAARLQLNKTGGSFSRLRHVLTFDPRQQTASLYARTTSGSGTANVGLRIGSSAGLNVAVTGEWQRFTYTHTDTSASDFQILLWDSIPGNDETADILIWGPQLEFASTPSEYQPVPTTWEQAYLDAVGAERIFAWQDSAGTTPVTAVGQTIGLSLDRAFGGRTDGSLIASGATGLTGTATAASYNTSTGAGSVSRAGDASNQSWVSWTGLTTSAIHRIRVTNTGATSLDVRNGSVSGTIVASIAAGETSYVHPLTSGGSTSITITATANSTTATFTLSEFARVPGTHRIQTSAPSRPLLMARVNLLLNSEDFSSASWAKGNATVSANAVTDPNGGTAADTITVTAGGSIGYAYQQLTATSTGYKGRMWVRAGTVSTAHLALRDVTAAVMRTATAAIVSGPGSVSVVGGVAQLSGLTSAWTCIELTATAIVVGNAMYFIAYVTSSSGPAVSAGDSISLWGADLRTADDAAKNIPAYQRVGATAADHDTAGFPHAAYPDGTDDFDTASTGGGGTSGFFFCGVLTVSGGAGTARTIWSDTGTNTGYRVRINSSNKLELAAGNGSAYTTVESNETITAPGTYLLSAWDDGGVLAVQVGNAAAATTARPAVSAGTSTITSYRDNGAATSYFNGRDYGSVYRQSYPGETAHNRLKQWQARRAGITA